MRLASQVEAHAAVDAGFLGLRRVQQLLKRQLNTSVSGVRARSRHCQADHGCDQKSFHDVTPLDEKVAWQPKWRSLPVLTRLDPADSAMVGQWIGGTCSSGPISIAACSSAYSILNSPRRSHAAVSAARALLILLNEEQPSRKSVMVRR